MKRRAFTLIELLVVIAVSSILFAIIVVPLVQSFNLTRAGQGFAQAQDRARILMERLTLEISNSAGVRDNSGLRGAQAVTVPGQNGQIVDVILEGVKLDLFRPAMGEETLDPDQPGVYRDPDTGRIDPTLRAPKGQVVLPVAPGATLVRYFVGLRRPIDAANRPLRYNNPYDGLLQRRNPDADNLYVLYRAEVQPRVFNRQTQRWEVNTALFDPDPNDPSSPLFDDPYFFTFRQSPGPNGEPVEIDWATGNLTAAGQAKAVRIRNWLRFSTVVTELSRFDIIQPVVEGTGPRERVIYDGNVPRLTALIRFSPSRVANEPATAMLASRTGEETFNQAKVGPDVFRTDFGGWTSAVIRLWPSQFPQVFNASQNAGSVYEPWRAGLPYLISRNTLPNEQGPPRFAVFAYDPQLGGEDDINAYRELFDVSTYLRVRRDEGLYPFTQAVRAADARSNWLSVPALVDLFIPHVPDARRGEVIASFPITEVGNPQVPPPAGLDNRPRVSPGPAYSPNNDPTLISGPPQSRWQDDRYRPSSPTSTINQRFNVLWQDWDALRGPGGDRSREVKRFVDLRFVPTLDGTPSPLQVPRASIVPGSEIVIGPDQLPGPNYGRPVRYTRVTQRPVGPNQYFINYVNQNEPDWALSGLLLPQNVYDPRIYDPTNFVQAILQPQFRAGYVEFNSRFGEPLPDGYVENGQFVPVNISIYYRVQFTEPRDVLAVDYDSRQVMTINLTIRNYAQTAQPLSQTVTLRGSATVRNFLR